MKKLFTVFYLSIFALSAHAQLNGTGFYRFRNAANSEDHISLTNNKFDYQEIIGKAWLRTNKFGLIGKMNLKQDNDTKSSDTASEENSSGNTEEKGK